MTRLHFSSVIIILAAFDLAVPVAARSHFLPRIGLPRINVGKALEAVSYPVTKSLINGGKDALKIGASADSLGLVPNIGPPSVSKVVKKALWSVGNH